MRTIGGMFPGSMCAPPLFKEGYCSVRRSSKFSWGQVVLSSLVAGFPGVTARTASHHEPTTGRGVQDRRPTLPPCWASNCGERPVLTSICDALIPQLASTDGHYPISARWFDLKSQGCWFESNWREPNHRCAKNLDRRYDHSQLLDRRVLPTSMNRS